MCQFEVLSAAAHCTKYCIWKGLQLVNGLGGHLRSLEKARFDRLSVTSSWWSTVTVSVFCQLKMRIVSTYCTCCSREKLSGYLSLHVLYTGLHLMTASICAAIINLTKIPPLGNVERSHTKQPRCWMKTDGSPLQARSLNMMWYLGRPWTPKIML